MTKKKNYTYVGNQAAPVNGARMMVHNGKTETSSEGNKVVSAPSQHTNWKEAAGWVVKAHAGAWKRLED